MASTALIIVLLLAAIFVGATVLNARYRRRAFTFVLPQGRHRARRRTA